MIVSLLLKLIKGEQLSEDVRDKKTIFSGEWRDPKEKATQL